MTKSKLKKSYCIMSFVFAVAVLIIAKTNDIIQYDFFNFDFVII